MRVRTESSRGSGKRSSSQRLLARDYQHRTQLASLANGQDSDHAPPPLLPHPHLLLTRATGTATGTDIEIGEVRATATVTANEPAPSPQTKTTIPPSSKASSSAPDDPVRPAASDLGARYTLTTRISATTWRRVWRISRWRIGGRRGWRGGRMRRRSGRRGREGSARSG